MEPRAAYRYFNKLEKDQFSLIYLGEFDDELTSTLMRINDTSVRESQVLKNKLSFLIAECFQNIIRHADKPDLVNRTNNKPKMFLLRNIGSIFYIASTNLIDNQKQAGLTTKLKSINTLSQEELKAAYISALAVNEFSEKGGAGLGLIEMARRSDCRLEYDFEFVNFYFSVFYMQLRVLASKEETNLPSAITLNSTKELYNAMLAENVLMIRKGDFSQQSILPVLQLIETNMSLQKKLPKLSKMAVYMLVELLQNISKHAAEHNGMREGIFIIAVKNNKYTLTAGNFIHNNEVEPLKARLKEVSALDPAALAEVYRSTLLEKKSVPGEGAGMGLIEICKYSSEKIKHTFIPVTDTLSFFSLNITV